MIKKHRRYIIFLMYYINYLVYLKNLTYSWPKFYRHTTLWSLTLTLFHGCICFSFKIKYFHNPRRAELVERMSKH